LIDKTIEINGLITDNKNEMILKIIDLIIINFKEIIIKMIIIKKEDKEVQIIKI
jgi:hypothetical protein